MIIYKKRLFKLINTLFYLKVFTIKSILLLYLNSYTKKSTILLSKTNYLVVEGVRRV